MIFSALFCPFCKDPPRHSEENTHTHSKELQGQLSFSHRLGMSESQLSAPGKEGLFFLSQKKKKFLFVSNVMQEPSGSI